MESVEASDVGELGLSSTPIMLVVSFPAAGDSACPAGSFNKDLTRCLFLPHILLPDLHMQLLYDTPGRDVGSRFNIR